MQSQKATSIKIDETLKARVQNLAKAKDRTAHWIMQNAISEYVQREEKLEQFRADTLAAYEDYVLTGHYIAHDAASEWLENLAKGIVTEPPQ